MLQIDYVSEAPVVDTVSQLIYFQDGKLVREEFRDSFHFAQRVKKLRNSRTPFNSRIR
jgi:hypothetical protein